jgi:hypothetical protein
MAIESYVQTGKRNDPPPLGELCLEMRERASIPFRE